jgi:hypothetical protein
VESIVKQVSCPQEQAVARAVTAGSWTDALAAHVEACSICRDVAQTTHWMRTVAGPTHQPGAGYDSQHSRPLPDPGLVWWRARLDNEPAKKSGRVLEWLQIATAVTVPLALAAWIAWDWYTIEAMAGQFFLSFLPQLPVATFVLPSMVPAALMVAALALGYPLLAGE